MFFYMGNVTEVLQPLPGSPYKRYKVRIPNVAEQPVEAFALDVPGLTTTYVAGDVVVISDVEAEDFDYLILGRLQRQVPDEKALSLLVVEQIEVLRGRISNEVNIANMPSSAASPQLGANVTPQEVSLKSIQADLHSMNERITSLETRLNGFGGGILTP